MSWVVAKICSERKFGSPVRKQIMMFLADKASDDGSGVWCSKGTIHRHTELGASTVKRAVSELVCEGVLIDTGERRRCKHGSTVVYRVNLELVRTLELISEPSEKVEDPSRPRPDGEHVEPGTGLRADGGLGPERAPNHPKTTQKPLTREREAVSESIDAIEAVLECYPRDRLRNKQTCFDEIASAINSGVLVDDLLEAVRAYAEETKGYTRSKVSFSDNWFKAGRWKKELAEIEASRIRKQEAELKGLEKLAAWIIGRHPLCRHITELQLVSLLAAGLVTEAQVRAAGLR